MDARSSRLSGAREILPLLELVRAYKTRIYLWRSKVERLSWIRKLNYLGHSVGGADKLIGLDPDELVDIATSTTGLSDFGDDHWKASFYESTKKLDSSENLHLLGRLQVRANSLRGLRNRLFVTDKIKLEPAILDEPTDNPLIITGLPRSGTTHLFELLSLDPAFRSPYCFEAISPVEPPPSTITGGIDRKKIAQGCWDFKNELLPELKSIHIHQHDLPEECQIIMHNVLSTRPFLYKSTGNYPDWAEGQNREYGYQWHKKVLQLLQYQQPTKRWLLKGPSHVHYMELVLSHYPNARIIQTHRDPVKTIPSFLNLIKTNNYTMLLESDTKRMEENSLHPFLMIYGGGLRRLIEQRQAGIVQEKQIFDIHMADLVSDPVTTVRSAYNHLGIEFSQEFEESISQFLAQNPRHKHGKHSYQPEDFGLSNRKIREHFSFYTDHYNISLNQ